MSVTNSNEFPQLSNTMDDGYLFAALDLLREVKQNGVLEIEDGIQCNSPRYKRFVKYSVLEECVRHNSKKLKMGILSVLIESKKTTLHFVAEELQLISTFLEHNMWEKMEFVVLIKKAFERIKGSYTFLREKADAEQAFRELEAEKSDVDHAKIVSSHLFTQEISRLVGAYRKFIDNVRSICIDCLSSDLFYARTRNCLAILYDMEDLLSEDFRQCAWTSEQAHVVMRCLLKDSSKVNKEIAFNIIKMLDVTLLELDEEDVAAYYMDKVFVLAHQANPADNMAAVYLLKVCMLSPRLHVQFENCELWRNVSTHEMKLFKILVLLTRQLKTIVQLASEDVNRTVNRYSTYSHIECIRTLLEYCDFSKLDVAISWRIKLRTVVELCLQLGDAVLVVENGNRSKLLTTSRKAPTGPRVTSEIGRGCCRRTIAEISLLFGELTARLPIDIHESMRDGMPAMIVEEVAKVGGYFVKTLSQTDHFFTFEQSYISFADLCSRLWRMKNEKLKCMPKMWMHEIVLAITGGRNNSRLYRTKEIAYQTFMAQAAICTEPTKDELIACFKNVKHNVLFGEDWDDGL